MDITDTSETTRTRRAVLIVATMAGCATMSAFGAELEAEVTAGATHTDNLVLEATNKQSELIYRIEPSFDFSHDGSRFTADVDYLLQAFRYRDLGENEVFHQYDVVLRADLVPENFFFEVGGGRSQTIRNPELHIPQNNLPLSDNRQDRDEFFAAPSFQFALGRSVVTQGEYRHTWVDYEDSDPVFIDAQGNEQQDAHFSIDNYKQNYGIAWALRYEWEHTEYDEEIIPFKYQQAVAEVGFWVGTTTRLFASGGRESAWDMPSDPSLEDTLWEVGFAQKVGERLSAEFAVGERSFGDSWRGMLDFQFRRGSTSLSYGETPTTEALNRFRRSDFDGPELPDDFLSRPGNTQRFISKRFQWQLNLDFQRSGLSFVLFDADRVDRTEADGTPLAGEAQRGAIASAYFRIGARTEFQLGGTVVRREFADGDASDVVQGSAGLVYRISERTSLSLEYEYTEEDGESDRFGDYAANYVSLLATRTF